MENRATTKRLYRSRDNHMIAGVCAGLAQYFNVDPVLMRLGFVAGLLIPPVGGLVFLAYIVLAIVVPQRPLEEAEPEFTGGTFSGKGVREIAGFVLVGLGAIALAGTLGLNHIVDGRYVGPLVLVALGAALLLRRQD